MNTAAHTAAPRISEGTRSAREILRSVPTMTSDPLALHRVDTSQIPRDADGCARGHMAIHHQPLRVEDDDSHAHVDTRLRRRVALALFAWCAVVLLSLVALLAHIAVN